MQIQSSKDNNTLEEDKNQEPDPPEVKEETDLTHKGQPYKVKDFTTELKYSLWTDLSGEQTEFMDAMDQLSYYQILKVNVFSLFDFSTIGNEMIQVQKQNFAKSIILQVKEA